jgi:hypothetical protein
MLRELSGRVAIIQPISVIGRVPKLTFYPWGKQIYLSSQSTSNRVPDVESFSWIKRFVPFFGSRVREGKGNRHLRVTL